MEDILSFKVAPYALQDVLDALSIRPDHRGFYNNLVVTKEDGELVVLCTKIFIKRNASDMNTCCELDLEDK